MTQQSFCVKEPDQIVLYSIANSISSLPHAHSKLQQIEIMACGMCVLIWVAVVIGGLAAILKMYTRLIVGRCTSKRNMSGKVVLVTGANAGIGMESVKELVMRNARVIMACRNMDKGKAAMDKVIRETGCDPSLVTLKQLDLSSLASIRKFAAELLTEERTLDILINNAGGATHTKEMTVDGLECNMASNHFGPFLLTNLLLPLLQAAPNPRIVNVASYAHWFAGSLDLDNVNSEKEWNPMRLYCRTKLANVLFTRELDRRLKAAGARNVTVAAVHPGNVRTEFNRYSEPIWYMNLGVKVLYLFFKSAEEGAQTTVHAAVSSEAEGVGGGYYQDCGPAEVSSLAQDGELGRRLWDVSAKMVKLQENESIMYKNN